MTTRNQLDDSAEKTIRLLYEKHADPKIVEDLQKLMRQAIDSACFHETKMHSEEWNRRFPRT